MSQNLCPKCGNPLARYQSGWKCNPCNSVVDSPASMAAQGQDPQLVMAQQELARTSGTLERTQAQLVACFTLASTGENIVESDTDSRWSLAYAEILKMRDDYELKIAALEEQLTDPDDTEESEETVTVGASTADLNPGGVRSSRRRQRPQGTVLPPK